MPPSLGNLTNLEWLDLFSNKLSIGKSHITIILNYQKTIFMDRYLKVNSSIPLWMILTVGTWGYVDFQWQNLVAMMRKTTTTIFNHSRRWFQIWKWVSLESCIVGVRLWIHFWIGFGLSCVLKWETKMASEYCLRKRTLQDAKIQEECSWANSRRRIWWMQILILGIFLYTNKFHNCFLVP